MKTFEFIVGTIAFLIFIGWIIDKWIGPDEVDRGEKYEKSI